MSSMSGKYLEIECELGQFPLQYQQIFIKITQSIELAIAIRWEL